VRNTHKRILKKAGEIRRRVYGIIPIDEIRKNHSRIMTKVEAAKTRDSNTARVENYRGSRQHSESGSVYKNNDDKKAGEIRGRIRGIVPIDEIRKNHSPIMTEAEAAKTSDNNTTSVEDVLDSRQHSESGSVYKKYNDIYQEPIDIWDEFLARREGIADDASRPAKKENTAADKPSKKPRSNIKNVQAELDNAAPLRAAADCAGEGKPGAYAEAPDLPQKSAAIDPPDDAPQEIDAADGEEAPETAGALETAASNTLQKARFPIAVKLLALIMVFLVLSLGAITLLVSILVSADVKLTAEDNNFSVNRRTAAAIQTKLRGVNAAVTMLFHDFEALKSNISPNNLKEAESSEAQFFFEQNPQIAAIALNDDYFINENFFRDNGGDSGMPRAWMLSAGGDLNAASTGAVLLRNATPFFGIPMLVMCIPLENYYATVFLNSETFNLLLGEGDNVSYLLNEEGDILLHADLDMLRGGVNFSKLPFVKNILDNSNSSMQNIYRDENGDEYFAAAQRLNIGSVTFITIIRTGVVFGGVMETIIRNIILSIIVLAASTIFIVLFSRTISVPLRSLTKAVAKIEYGDYDLQLKAGGNDELGVLTRNFTGMSNSLENFEKFTNKAIVKLAKGGKLSSSGVNKRATICFAMIRDFSEVSDGLDAASIVDFVNDYLRLMVPCITGNGGCVDKFLTQGGVIVMALWGTPETAGSPKKDALNCIRAALSMRAALRCLNQKRLRKFGSHIPLVKLGCGINTGELIAGQIGSDERMEYTVIGDTVNLAARIEGPNDLFDTDILISEETYKYVSAYLIVKEMRGIAVKGKEKPLRVFSVVNMRDPLIADSMLDNLQKMPGIDIDVCKKCIGPGGPGTVEEVRESWRV
jgi:adenylate cyclase